MGAGPFAHCRILGGSGSDHAQAMGSLPADIVGQAQGVVTYLLAIAH
jgi:hypothetical protein